MAGSKGVDPLQCLGNCWSFTVPVNHFENKLLRRGLQSCRVSKSSAVLNRLSTKVEKLQKASCFIKQAVVSNMV